MKCAIHEGLSQWTVSRTFSFMVFTPKKTPEVYCSFPCGTTTLAAVSKCSAVFHADVITRASLRGRLIMYVVLENETRPLSDFPVPGWHV